MEAEFQRMGGDIDGVSIGDLRLMLLLYADDAVILSDTPHGLQNILTRLHIIICSGVEIRVKYNKN